VARKTRAHCNATRRVAKLDQKRHDQDRSSSSSAASALPLSILGQAFEATPIGLVILDAHANIVAVNRVLSRIFGYQSADLVGKPIALLAPIRLREVQQSSHSDSPSFAQNARAVAGGRELLARHADGRQIPVQVAVNAMTTPQATMLVASVVETSPRGNLENAFGRIFASATHGMALVNEDGRIALLNEHLAAMLGYVQADLTGQRVEILLPERYRASHNELMRSFREAPTTRRMGVGRDLTARHASGADLPVEIGLSEVHWQGRRMTLVTVVDISVRRRIEMELKLANENLREFTRVASHDLRSPLRGIADLVQWVREDLGENPKPEVVYNLERIADRVSRLELLLSDLLRYARSEQIDADCVHVDFAALVRDILRVDPLPSGFHIDVTVNAGPIWAPWTPLETVLRNLITNAVKHHDRTTGHIGVEVCDEDGFCRVAVTDDGPGFAEHAKERVFRLFQTTGSARRSGLGLGLALAKRLVEVHGGRMELVSPLLDQRGSSFRLWWPRNARILNNA